MSAAAVKKTGDGKSLRTHVVEDLRLFRERWRNPAPAPEFNGARIAGTVLLLLMGVMLIGLAVDAKEGIIMGAAGPAMTRLAEMTTRLGLSGYIFTSSLAVCVAALILRARGVGKLYDACLGVLASRSAYVIVANAVAGIASQVIKHLVGRARPKMLATLGPFHFDFFAIKAKYASLPSGHSTTAFVTAAALIYFMPRMRVPLYFIAVSVGVSRLLLGAHFPSDVLSGALLGCVTAWLLARSFARRRIAFRFDGEGQVRPRGFRVEFWALRRLWRTVA